MTGDINLVLEQLAKGFNVTVDKLYPILIKQAYISGISLILTVLVLIATLITLFKITVKSHKNYDRKPYCSWVADGGGIAYIFFSSDFRSSNINSYFNGDRYCTYSIIQSRVLRAR